MSAEPVDRGPVFDGVRIGRPATGALVDAGHRTLRDLPDDLAELAPLHGVGPSAIARLRAARVSSGSTDESSPVAPS